jgi:hypothetical protein
MSFISRSNSITQESSPVTSSIHDDSTTRHWPSSCHWESRHILMILPFVILASSLRDDRYMSGPITCSFSCLATRLTDSSTETLRKNTLACNPLNLLQRYSISRNQLHHYCLRADGTVPTRASSSKSAARGFSSTKTLPSNPCGQAGRHLSLKMEFHHTSSRPSVDGHPSRSKSTVTKASCAHPIPFAWSTTGSNPNLLNNSFFKTGHFSSTIFRTYLDLVFGHFMDIWTTAQILAYWSPSLLTSCTTHFQKKSCCGARIMLQRLFPP